MNKSVKEESHHLFDVVEELGLKLKLDLVMADIASEQVYTFETHPFYSSLGDYSEVEFIEGL